jgi:hypothetical protein
MQFEEITLWEGTKSWLRGIENSGYEVYEFEGREIGILKMVDEYDPRYGTTCRVYETSRGEIVIHLVEWAPLNEEQRAVIAVYDNLCEAAEDGFDRVLLNMIILDRFTFLVEDWRKEWIKRNK